MLGDTGNKRSVRILLECILVYDKKFNATKQVFTCTLLSKTWLSTVSFFFSCEKYYQYCHAYQSKDDSQTIQNNSLLNSNICIHLEWGWFPL